MAHDENLAERVRQLVHEQVSDAEVREQKMFGGLSFLLDGRLAVCVSGGGLLLKPPSDAEALLELEHVEPMRMGRQVSHEWLRVGAAAVADGADLAAWVERGIRGTAGRARGRSSAR